MCNLPSLLFLTLKVTKTLPYSLECEILRPYKIEPLQKFLLVWGSSLLKSGKKIYKRKPLGKVWGKKYLSCQYMQLKHKQNTADGKPTI